MGKLKELREEREQMNWDDPRRIEVEEEINKTEQWCIDNHPDWGIKLSKWRNDDGDGSPDYPWHTGYVSIKDIGMVGELNGLNIHYNGDKSVHVCSKCNNI